MTTDNRKLDRNVVLTGLTSFFTDVSSEMVYPLLQGFITVVMKTQAVFLGPVLGIIEGVAESTASLLKVFSGYYSDKYNTRKLPVIAGYSLSALSKILFFIPFWFSVLGARFFDRVGKGIRTAPRDALIAESTPKDMQGKAFGFQRGMDFAGAFLGTVICYLLLRFALPGVDKMEDAAAFYPVFVIALIPAFLGVVFLFFTREKQEKNTVNNGKVKPKPNLDIRKYDKNLRLFFILQFIFTLGNSSNQFLLLRSVNLGFALSTVLLMYIVFNLITTILSPIFGSLSDRIGRKKVMAAGYILYVIVYIAFGFIPKEYNALLWLFWPVYGVYYALTDGVEKAFVSESAPSESKGTALGFYHTIIGIGLLPASLIAGFLFMANPGLPYIFSGIMALTAVIILVFFVKEQKPA